MFGFLKHMLCSTFTITNLRLSSWQLHQRPPPRGQWEYFRNACSLAEEGNLAHGIPCLFVCVQLNDSSSCVGILQPFTEGYIAVILPKFEESKSITENLLSREEFEKVVLKRSESQPSWQRSVFLHVLRGVWNSPPNVAVGLETKADSSSHVALCLQTILG